MNYVILEYSVRECHYGGGRQCHQCHGCGCSTGAHSTDDATRIGCRGPWRRVGGTGGAGIERDGVRIGHVAGQSPSGKGRFHGRMDAGTVVILQFFVITSRADAGGE